MFIFSSHLGKSSSAQFAEYVRLFICDVVVCIPFIAFYVWVAGLTLEGDSGVGQKRSSSRHVILKSCPMSPPVYFLHLSFIKMSISCTCLLKSIIHVSVIKYFESDFLGK
jgi:hypothetical protein